MNAEVLNCLTVKVIYLFFLIEGTGISDVDQMFLFLSLEKQND